MNKKKLLVFIIAHDQGLKLVQAYRSVNFALQKYSGQSKSQIRISLDSPDHFTKSIAEKLVRNSEELLFSSYQNFARTRNSSIDSINIKSIDEDVIDICFLDANDTVSSDWFCSAISIKEKFNNVILHPQYSLSKQDNQYCIEEKISSTDSTFNSLIFFDDGYWNSVTLSSLKIFRKFPYPEFGSHLSNGFNSQAWNISTIENGIEHLIVPDTFCFSQVS